MIPYSKQNITNDDIKSVVKVLKSKILTQGKEVVKFEKNIAKFVGSKYSIAVSSASAALHLSCLALELKKNEILWTVPNTFIASASCALHCQAGVDFVDIDEATSNISIDKLKAKLISAKKKNCLPKVLVPVHFAGQPTEQKEIYSLSKKYKFKIIEDASHSLGAFHKKERVGSCKWSDLTVFSFHPVKPITTAEGGIITTNNKKYYEKLIKLRNHGISRNYNELKIKSNWYYEQQLLGFNYRMNEMQAALGTSQLKKIKKFNDKRNMIANFYYTHLKKLPIKLPLINKENYSSFHLFVIKVDRNIIKRSYDKIYKDLIAKGLGVNLHYLPVHLHPVFKKLGFEKGDFPISEKHASSAFSIPVFYNLKNNELKKIVKILKKVFTKKDEK
jgi:UDP-4-amino-4,6-dideoxy-N-acetyl-beta-L-altrosamine transaminase